ncbi:MAG: translation initiation factor IF-2 [Acidobacteria bacterium]|nr:MAG: translation initiation factor IF-2 [Acidobacteriota bacterium]
MESIRINELARELEVKSKAILDYLSEIGVTDKKSHSSALEDEVAEKVRAHFRALNQEATEKEPATARKGSAAPAKTARVSPPSEAKRGPEVRPEFQPIRRSIAEIKAEARKAVAPASPRPVTAAERVAEKVSAAAPSATGSPAGPARIPFTTLGPATRGPAVRPPVAGKPVEGPSVAGRRAGGVAEAPAPAKPGEAPLAKSVRGSRGGRLSDPAASQPIYPQAILPKGVPTRAPGQRRPGEPRPMHPTAARPAPSAAAGAVATGGAPATRPAVGRPFAPPRHGPYAPHLAPPRPVVPEEVPITRQITLSEGITVKELSEKLEVRAKDVIKKLLDRGLFATINQTLDSETAKEIARSFGADATIISFEEIVKQEVEEADRPEDLKPRAPVVTVMGHVDHGKTSLLDAIREANVAAKEAGGITQRIGAYQAEVQNRKITFIDTPGHEAFTMMRARGAKATDVVVLVVAADDGVMPQTLEAMSHARAAKVPMLVAINKIDKPEAQPERVKKQLADQGLLAEAWGGDTVMVEVSAKQKKNLDVLLEMILLVADLQALKANPDRLASGTVLEAKLDRGRGPVATVLVQNGTLHVGDSFIVGATFGKVRAMFDDRGHPCFAGPPSAPVEVLGFEDVPQAGDRFQVSEDAARARQISLHRQAKLREAALAKSARLTLEHLHEQLAAGDIKELPLIIKADVQGSVEVLSDTLNKLSSVKVKIKIIHAAVGAITETDVLLASASNAVIIGFNVRPERKASDLAQLENVDIRPHTIIYDVTDEIKKAMVGLLSVTYKETTLGRAAVRDTFRISKVGTVAGCHVQDGKIARESRIRLLRDNVVTYEGRIRSLRRFKEDVTEVKSGMECGIALENFSDIKVGDVIEAFVTERVAEPALA